MSMLLPPVLALLLAPLYALWVALRGRGEWLRHRAFRTIDAEAARIHALLDPSCADNRWSARGWRVEPTGERDRWRVIEPSDPHPLLFVVTECAPRLLMTILVRREDGEAIGAVRGSVSRYEIEALAGSGCRVGLEETVSFARPMSRLAYAFHELLYRFAIGLDLARLKREAEAG
jgi:hypothetical protein